jgi:hypothetical protein
MKRIFLPLDRPTCGDVDECQQDGPFRAFVEDDFSGVEKHCSSSHEGETGLNFEAVHRCVRRNDRFQQKAKRRNVPLAISQGIEQAAVCTFRINFEGLIKRAAGNAHMKAIVKDEERIMNRIDDGLCQHLGIFNIAEIDHGQTLSSFESSQGMAASYSEGDIPLRELCPD